MEPRQTRAHLLVGVLEDEAAVARVVDQALRLSGHHTVLARTGAEALALFGTDSGVHALVLDIGLPDADGRDVCRALRDVGQEAPALFLTAHGTTLDRLSAFDAGADDFLAKPFDVAELCARVQALGRRGPGALEHRSGLVLDAAHHAARVADREVLLTPIEFRVLAAITRGGDGVVGRDRVLTAGWPGERTISANTLDSFMRRIREKLAHLGSPVSVETVRGVGFRLVDGAV